MKDVQQPAIPTTSPGSPEDDFVKDIICSNKFTDIADKSESFGAFAKEADGNNKARFAEIVNKLESKAAAGMIAKDARKMRSRTKKIA